MEPSIVLIAAVILLFYLGFILYLLKSRYQTFTTQNYVIRFRNGKLVNEGYGGGYFLIPFIDLLIILPATTQMIKINTSENLNWSKEEDDTGTIMVSGLMTWKISDFTKFCSSGVRDIQLEESGNVQDMSGMVKETSHVLEEITTATIHQVCMDVPLEKLYRNRSILKDAILERLEEEEERFGIEVEDMELNKIRKKEIVK